MPSIATSDAQARLDAAPKRGYAAVVILKCADDGSYVWQRKTPGYPVPSQVGGLCLFGGNKEDTDLAARATLERELREELGPEAAATLTPFSRFIIDASAEVMSPKPAYCFTCCVFVATLPTAPSRTAEGILEVHSIDSLQSERFCWGYHEVFNAWATQSNVIMESGSCAGIAPTLSPLPACELARLTPDADVGQWAAGEKWC